MTCINKSVRRENTSERKKHSRIYVYLRSFSTYNFPINNRSSIIYPVHVYLAASRWQFLPNDPSISRHAKSVISSSSSCVLLRSERFHNSCYFYVPASRERSHRRERTSSERSRYPCSLSVKQRKELSCKEFSNSPVSSFSLTYLKFSCFCDFKNKFSVRNLKLVFFYLYFK